MTRLKTVPIELKAANISIADLCDLKELLEDVPTVDAVERIEFAIKEITDGK